MNTLSDLTLDTPTLDRPTITNGTITNSDLYQPGMLDLGVNSTIIVHNDASIMLDGEIYTGGDLKDIFKLVKVFKEIHPEVFLVQ